MAKHQVRQQLFEEFEYKEKPGTAWSHNYLNQKPWHPMSYPNQRRKWIAEQMHGMTEKRKSDVEKEFEKEQDFFKSSALLSKKQRKKVELMQSVSFMYTKPPGYNAESARAAELADEKRQEEAPRQQQEQLEGVEGGAADGEGGGGGGRESTGTGVDEALVLAKTGPMGGHSSVEGASAKRKPIVRDVFGNKVATEEDFEILKNAPREDTGIIGRAKPFGVELRNVRCGRCGTVGHQSGDRECLMKDVVSEADLKRQQREDPLSLILVQNRAQGFTWEPKQALGGFSPPRGGFRPDDPNQQILAPEEDEEGGPIDPYGGFLVGPDGVDPGLEGVSQQVLDALTKRQRKELRRALKAREKEEKRKKRRKGKSKSKKHKVEKRKKRKTGGSDSSDSSDSSGSSGDGEEKQVKKPRLAEREPSGGPKVRATKERRKEESSQSSSGCEGKRVERKQSSEKGPQHRSALPKHKENAKVRGTQRTSSGTSEEEDNRPQEFKGKGKAAGKKGGGGAESLIGALVDVTRKERGGEGDRWEGNPADGATEFDTSEELRGLSSRQAAGPDHARSVQEVDRNRASRDRDRDRERGRASRDKGSPEGRRRAPAGRPECPGGLRNGHDKGVLKGRERRSNTNDGERRGRQ